MPLSLTLPSSWQELTQPRLRYAYALLSAGRWTAQEVKTLCLLRWNGLAPAAPQPATAPPGTALLRRAGRTYAVAVRQLAAALSALDWMDAPPAEPLRIGQWQGRRAADPLLQGTDFGTYLRLENLWQGFLLSRSEEALDRMAALLYEAPTGGRKTARWNPASPLLRYSTACWYAALKGRFARQWPDLFRPAAPSAAGAPSRNSTPRRARPPSSTSIDPRRHLRLPHPLPAPGAGKIASASRKIRKHSRFSHSPLSSLLSRKLSS